MNRQQILNAFQVAQVAIVGRPNVAEVRRNFAENREVIETALNNDNDANFYEIDEENEGNQNPEHDENHNKNHRRMNN